MEVSFREEIASLRLGEGEALRGEGTRAAPIANTRAQLEPAIRCLDLRTG
jgi:hypothetical protein